MDNLITYARENPLPALLALLTGLFTANWLLKRFNPNPSVEPVLSTQVFRQFPLINKRIITHNTARYRFGLPTEKSVLGLPIGQHITVRATIDGKSISRSYTPVSSDDDLGYFDLVIKSYPAGNVSKMFSELKIGDKIEVRGPKGAFKYRPNLVANIGMIAGGTGITPMLQIINAILKNPDDHTNVSLIFGNIAEEDILLRDDLDQLAQKHENFNVYYVLNNPPDNWTGGVGFVSEEMIRQHCPPPAPDTKILLCGPPPMVKAMTGCCVAVGFEEARVISKMEDQVFKF